MKQLSGAPAPIVTDEPQWIQGSGAVRGHASATILKPAQEVYDFWRNIENAAVWMERIVRVEVTGEKTSRWTMLLSGEDKDGKDAREVSWNSEIVTDVPGEKIAWRSVEQDGSVAGPEDAGSKDSLDEAGEIVFYDRGERGTEVLLILETRLPGGALSNALAGAAARSPRQTVIENLRHAKAMLETGEIPTVKGQPHGPRGISGGIKEIMYGEHNPEPPGSSRPGSSSSRAEAVSRKSA
jgi:uncharacterized membrane protein